ncbi:MAG TPA: tetratricopeptide repeat protein [Bacteroidia bacterium]|nr:tetratricopeptide repeat protein [Bacteroidia bacterium]
MNQRLFLYLLFPVLLLASCSSGKKTTTTPAPAAKNKKPLTEEERLNLQYIFVNANRDKILGNYEKAADEFAQCIRIDGTNFASMYELAQIYRGAKKYSEALFFAQSAAMGDPSNTWYRTFYADLLLDTRKLPEAEKEYGSLYKDYPDRIDFGFSYAGTLLMNGKTQDAIKVYDEIEKQTGVTEELIREKQRLYLKMGNVEKAAAEIEKLIQDDPQELRYYSMLTDLYQANDMPDKALETINRMKAIDPESPQVYLALAEYYRKTNQKEKSFEQLKLAFASPQMDADVKIRIISSYLPLIDGNPEMLAQGTELGKILAETHPSNAIALAIYGDFLSMNMKFEEALKNYEASLQIDPKNFTVWQQLFICQSQINDYDGMLKYSEEALSLYPDQAIVYLFNGIALNQKKDYAGAVKSFMSGSKIVVDNDDLMFRFYSGLGDCYNELKDYVESDNFYDKALKIYPDDAFVLNNYSYYLSERGEQLDKAEKMSRHSNEIRPGQSSFEDTYAWILYKMEKYEDARTWLQKALSHGGDSSGTILEHMGDVLYRLKDTTGAVDFWNKAKMAGGGSELLDKKIKDQKLYE